MFDGGIDARDWIGGDIGRQGGAAGRAEGRNGKVRRAVGNDPHGDEHDHQVHPDGRVREPAILGQRPHLTDAEAHDAPQQTADGITQFELRDLRNGLSVADDNQTHPTNQLDTLEDVDDVARNGPVQSEGQVTVVLHWEFVGIEAQEDPPQQVSGAGTKVRTIGRQHST